uniref:Uncharacterized protein n=1 Tax=Acrobeloides nanus TaxID=290746 RepID=A0A914D7C8_9BILA
MLGKIFRRSRSRSCRRIPHSPFLPRKTKAKPEKLQKFPKSPSEKNLDLYDFLWAKTPELLTYYSSGCTNRKSLYSITVDTGKKQIGFPVARPEIFLDLIRVLLPYQIVIKSKCISEISPKAYRMILAGSAVSISNSA